jgi:signal transduction histidine kinase
MASTGRIYWVLGAFVFVVLLLLVVAPLILNYRQGNVLEVIDRAADPADKAISELHTALSEEASAISGFQSTGDKQYPFVYQDRSAKIEQILTDLREWVPQLGSDVAQRFKESQAAIEEWQATVARDKLVTEQLAPAEFQKVFFRRQYILDHAHQAITTLSQTITTWRTNQRAAGKAINQFAVQLGVILAALALAASIVLFTLLRRLVSTQAHQDKRAREEESLLQIAHSLTSAVALDDLLRRITEGAAFAVQAEGVYIELLSHNTDRFTCVADYGSGVPATRTTGEYEGSLVQEVLRTGEPKIIPDVRVEANRRSVFGELARDCHNCSGMVVPLVADHDPLGALFLIRSQPKYFNKEEFSHVKILADMASLAIRRAISVETIQKMQEEEHFIAEASGVLASSLDYTATLKAVAQLAVPRIADWCAIHLLTNGLRMAQIAHTDPVKVQFFDAMQEKYPTRPDRSIVGSVIRTGKSELHSEIPDALLKRIAQSSEHYELLRELKLKSAIVVPLASGKELFGGLVFMTEEGGRRLGHDDLEFAEDVARHMALAIQNSRLYNSAERAVVARDEVLRVVSHDLRNPVSNIQMTARMLATSSLPEQKRQNMVQIINRAADRMNRLLDDLIAVARIREGQDIPLDVHPDNPADIIEEACLLFDVQARAKSIELTCEKPVAVPTVRADRHRVLQILSNLLDNAIKFTPEGGRIGLRCEAHDVSVRFEVSDTGRGIEPAHLSKIFDLYWQAKPTAHMGSGFGLAISKAVVEQHGGKIWAESTPGLGTRFFFTLPQAGLKDEITDRERPA